MLRYLHVAVMKKILQIGMEMQNKAAMENITLDKAYEKYGKPAYEKYGVEWKLGGSSNTIRVKDLKTGQTGTIPESEFDSAKYLKL